MWTSNIINRRPDDPPVAPLISLTRPSPAHCTPCSSIFFLCVSMPWCAIWLLAAFPGLKLTSLYHDSIWTRAAVGEGTIGDHFSNKWSRLLRFWNFRSTVVCFVWKAAFGPAPEEFYHFCDHQLIKTDEIVGHRGVLDALGGQFIQTPSSMLRRRCFHENLFICFNQQRFIGLRQRYEVRFFSSAINTLKLILYSYTLIGNNLLALFICVIYFCDCSSFSSKKRSYPKIHME